LSSQTRAQHGIQTEERFRRTPYHGFLREPGDSIFRGLPPHIPVAKTFRDEFL
jgi:hypothetical protein